MSLKLIQITALVGSGIASGGNFYISAFGIPALLSPYSSKGSLNKNQAALLAKALQTQWQQRFFPSLSALTSSAYLYLACNSPKNRSLYLLSAFSSIAIVPYTLLGMMGNIKKIQKMIQEEEDPQDLPRLRGEIATWGETNYGRAALLFVAFLAGTWAAVDGA